MKKNEIQHTGEIIDITPDFTTVKIIASSACSGCHAKSLCGMSEDIDAELDEAIKMLKEAGLDAYLAEAQNQLTQFKQESEK